MKRISLILLISFCTMVPELQAEMSKEELHKIEELQKQFELFTACKPIDLFVTDLPPDAKKINLTEKAIINSMESRLRSARIFNDKSVYKLNVVINVVGDAFSISLGLIKILRDKHFPELVGIASSWETGVTGTHGGRANFILSSISGLVDEFLVEYFRVNEKACNKTR